MEPKEDEIGALGEIFIGETEWIYIYPRPAGITDVVYTVQVSTDEETWTVVEVVHERVSTSSGWELWQARYPRDSVQKVVFRLAVTQR